MTTNLFLQPPPRLPNSTKWRKYAGRDILPAWVADMDYPAAASIIAAMEREARHGVFGYCDIDDTLAETTAAYFGRRWGWQVSPEWLVFLPGLGPGIHGACRLADGGDILTPSPIYHVFRYAPAMHGARRIDTPMICQNGEWQLPTEVLAAHKTPNTRVLQLCNPHNPNGKIYNRRELEEVAAFCLRESLILCADEVHADLLLDEDKKHICIASLSPEIAARSITLQSPSKAFNVAGLNFAVAVIPDAALRRRFVEVQQGRMIGNLNPFGMAAAAAAWGGECEDWLQAVLLQLRTNRDVLSAAVENMAGVQMPHLSATYLAWLCVRESGLTAADFERGGVGLSDGKTFGDVDYMRLNFACAPKLLDEIIARLQKMLA